MGFCLVGVFLMAQGAGKYDDLCTHVREQSQAGAAIVIVVDGNRGSGFSCQTRLPALEVVKLLEEVADMMKKSVQ